MSYYDKNFGYNENVVFTAENVVNYDHIYQHDTRGMNSEYGFNSDTAWFANTFVASPIYYLDSSGGSNAGEEISAVSFYTPQIDSDYLIQIYKDTTNEPINPNGLTINQ